MEHRLLLGRVASTRRLPRVLPRYRDYRDEKERIGCTKPKPWERRRRARRVNTGETRSWCRDLQIARHAPGRIERLE